MEEKYERVPMHVKPLDDEILYGCSPAAKEHILKSMSALSRGKAPTPSFKLYGRTDVTLVDDFFKSLKSSGIKIPEWQLEYEMSRKTKWGPQGGYAPWDEVKDAFELYYSRPQRVDPDFKYLVDDKIYDKYKSMHCKMLPVDSTLAELIANDKINDRAAGWRDFNLSKKDRVAQEHAIRDARSGVWQKGLNYVFERYNKLKKRIFFPGPYSLMLLEAQYYSPFLRYIQDDLRKNKDNSPFLFWADKIGFQKQFVIVDNLYQKVTVPTRGTLVYVQRDFEKMDTTTGWSQTYNSMYKKLCKAFSFSSDSKEAQRLYNILRRGSEMPVITPAGVYYGTRGKASGQETTNGDETCANEDYDNLLQNFLAHMCQQKNIKFKILYSGGNGDDGISIYILNDEKDLDIFKTLIAKAADISAQIMGFRVQGDKWFIDTSYGLYCQNMVAVKNNHIWYGYPATLILNAIVNPEQEYKKADWDKDYRDLDIIEKLDNGRNLEYFHELVDFVDNGMKYRLLGRTEDETRRIFSKYEKYRALRQDKFNHQDDMSEWGLSSSPTVNYLMSKRGWIIPR